MRENIRQMLGEEGKRQRSAEENDLRRRLDQATRAMENFEDSIGRSAGGKARSRLQKRYDDSATLVEALERRMAEVAAEAAEYRRLRAADFPLITEAADLVAMLERGTFEFRRQVIERAVAFVEFDFGTRAVTINLNLS